MGECDGCGRYSDRIEVNDAAFGLGWYCVGCYRKHVKPVMDMRAKRRG